MRVRSFSPLPVLIGWVQNIDVRVWGLAWLQPFCVTINGGRICFNFSSFFFGSVWLYANKTSFSMKWYSDTKMKQTTQQNYPNQIWDDIHAVNRKIGHIQQNIHAHSLICVCDLQYWCWLPRQASTNYASANHECVKLRGWEVLKPIHGRGNHIFHIFQSKREPRKWR